MGLSEEVPVEIEATEGGIEGPVPGEEDSEEEGEDLEEATREERAKPKRAVRSEGCRRYPCYTASSDHHECLKCHQYQCFIKPSKLQHVTTLLLGVKCVLKVNFYHPLRAYSRLSTHETCSCKNCAK